MTRHGFKCLEYWIDGLILSAVISISLLYFMYFSDFAETHIQFSFLNFPIFIGEMLLIFCGTLSILKLNIHWKTRKITLNAWHQLIIAYFIWVLIKAFYGYATFGPLAFRNAALFYYPAFSLIIYYSYQVKGGETFKPLLVVLLTLLYFIQPIIYYYSVPYIVILIVLTLSIDNKTIRKLSVFVILIVLLLSTNDFFKGSRSHIVAIFSTFIYLFGSLYVLFKNEIRKRVQVVIFVILFIYCFMGVFLFADKNGLKTLIGPLEIVKRYQKDIKIIKEKEKKFKFMDIQTKLYNQNKNDVFHTVESPQKITTKIEHKNEEGVALVKQESIQEESIIEDLREKKYRNLDLAYGNSVFRLLIWRDMMIELWDEKAWLGLNFGKPQRSKSIEILHWAQCEWRRDGWITPHNSFLHVIYRAGIIGLLVLGLYFWLMIKMAISFLKHNSVIGCLLISIIIYWMMLACFLVVWELPYFAIPFWSIFGVTLAYSNRLEREAIRENTSHS